MPIVELFRGEHLACKPHRAQTLKLEGREQIHIGDVHHDSGHPKEEVHPVLLEHLEDLRWEGSEMGRQHHKCAGLCHQHAEFEAVDIEHNRRERSHHKVIVEVECVNRPVDKVEETLMIEHHTLWRSCGTGCINDT